MPRPRKPDTPATLHKARALTPTTRPIPVRFDGESWDIARAIASRRGTSLSHLLRLCINRYIADPERTVAFVRGDREEVQ